MDDDRFIKECPILFKKYKVKKKIGQGAFGAVFLGQTIKDNKYVAIKVERRKISKPLLESEAYLLSNLKGLGIPKIISFGKTRFYTVLIEPLFGKTLFDIFIQNGKQFHPEELCLIALQVIERLETIHAQYIIHRDIKPDNFVMGKGIKSKYLYLLDFGLAKKYRSSSTLKHYPLVKKKHLTGTARYASINALNGYTQSRRDDLEAIGYVLVYFLLGRLPWQGMLNKNKDERYMKIMEIKRDTDPHDLCKGLPVQFEKYISYTRSLEYEQDPDYSMLKQLFLKVLNDEGLSFDHYYDWDSDVGTMTTSDTNFNFAGKVVFKNAEVRQIEQINKEENINEEKDEKSMENILDNNNNNNNKKLDDIKKEVMESKIINENKENEDEKEKENKKEENLHKNEKLNEEKNEDNNDNKDIDKNGEYFDSGIIKGEKKKNKRSEHVQCCLIM